MEKLTIHNLLEFEKIAQVLSNKNRLKILQLLKEGEFNINEISQKLNIPMPTVTVNIQKLEQQKIISCRQAPGKQGKQKICSINYGEITFKLIEDNIKDDAGLIKETATEYKADNKAKYLVDSINIALNKFKNYSFTPEWGLATKDKVLEQADKYMSQELHDRQDFQIIWFNTGFIAYDFTLKQNNSLHSLTFSLESCSDHMYFNHNWPSDLSFYLNDIELGTYTSEGYFGHKGKLTPSWWPNHKPQHGERITIVINNEGVFINEKLVNDRTIEDFSNTQDFIFKIQVKEESKNARGAVIFGESFGNYPQGIKIDTASVKL